MNTRACQRLAAPAYHAAVRDSDRCSLRRADQRQRPLGRQAVSVACREQLTAVAQDVRPIGRRKLDCARTWTVEWEIVRDPADRT